MIRQALDEVVHSWTLSEPVLALTERLAAFVDDRRAAGPADSLGKTVTVECLQSALSMNVFRAGTSTLVACPRTRTSCRGSLRRPRRCPRRPLEPHERRVEVDVVGGARGAAGVSRELMLVGGPRAVRDLALDACFHDHCELGRGAVDALAELARRPILRTCKTEVGSTSVRM